MWYGGDENREGSSDWLGPSLTEQVCGSTQARKLEGQAGTTREQVSVIRKVSSGNNSGVEVKASGCEL